MDRTRKNKAKRIGEYLLRHWRDRSEYHTATGSSEDDGLDYTIVPLEAAGTVAVKYKYAGELQPLPYQPDE